MPFLRGTARRRSLIAQPFFHRPNGSEMERKHKVRTSSNHRRYFSNGRLTYFTSRLAACILYLPRSYRAVTIVTSHRSKSGSAWTEVCGVACRCQECGSRVLPDFLWQGTSRCSECMEMVGWGRTRHGQRNGCFPGNLHRPYLQGDALNF